MMTHNSSTNNNDATINIRTVLDDQYLHLEAYCQAQTLLSNTMLTVLVKGGGGSNATPRTRNNRQAQDNERMRALLCVKTSLRQVQEDLAFLQNFVASSSSLANNNNNNVLLLLLRQHLSLSQRVLSTVREPYHANGIVATTQQRGLVLDPHEGKIMALATLRASAARLLETMSS